jgi:predicted membrane protein
MKKEDLLTLAAFLFITFGIMEIFNLSFRASSQISIFILLVGLIFTYLRFKWRSRKANIEAEKSLNNLSNNIGSEKDIIAQYRETSENIENPEKKLEAMKALDELEKFSLTHL